MHSVDEDLHVQTMKDISRQRPMSITVRHDNTDFIKRFYVTDIIGDMT